MRDTSLLPERHTSRVLDPSLCWGLSCAPALVSSLENKGDETSKALLIAKQLLRLWSLLSTGGAFRRVVGLSCELWNVLLRQSFSKVSAL